MSLSNSDIQQEIQRGIDAYRAGDVTAAAEQFKSVLQSHPGRPRASYWLGVALVAQGELKEALPLLELVVAARPQVIQFRTELGELQRRLGMNEKAETTYRAAIKIDANCSNSLRNLGELLYARDSHFEAIECLSRARELEPDSAAITNALALTLTRAGRADDAVDMLEQQLQREPQCAVSLCNLAVARAELGEIEKSESLARRVLELDPEQAAAYVHLGRCRLDAGDARNAVEPLREALRRAPNQPMAYSYLGNALMASGARDEAMAVFAAGAKLHSSSQSMADGWQETILPAANQAGTEPAAFAFKWSHLQHALEAIGHEGLICEFGVYMGRTLQHIAEYAGPDAPVHGFDSFHGLPESWTEQISAGAYDSGGILPDLPANTRLHVGWFNEVLPGFVADHPGDLAFAHIDCDIYSSTVTILKSFAGRIVPGTILVFDEYFCYTAWREHEYKSFREFCEQQNLSYEYLALSPMTGQATVRII